MSGVLVVDDEKLIRLLLSRALKKEGITVVDAENGNEAREKIKKRRFDLVILDLRLGDINGVDLLKDMRATSPETMVIVITAYGSDDLKKEIEKQGVKGYYEKPFDTFEIIDTVKKCLHPDNPVFNPYHA